MSDLVRHGQVNTLIRNVLRRKPTQLKVTQYPKSLDSTDSVFIKQEDDETTDNEGMFSFLEERPFIKVEAADTSFSDVSFDLGNIEEDNKTKNPFSIRGRDRSKQDIDLRSIYIGNVDYGTKPVELQQIFSSAGLVNRVTIMLNKYTGYPKGFAYLEFNDNMGVLRAVHQLDGYLFRGRCLKVKAKRTNIPGKSGDLQFCTRGRPDLVHKFIKSRKRRFASKGRDRYI